MDHNDPTDLRARQLSDAEREQKRLLEIRQESEDLKWLMADRRGRRFMRRLLAATGYKRNPFTGNSTTFFNCGEMNVGLAVEAWILNTCPDRYFELMKEHMDNG